MINWRPHCVIYLGLGTFSLARLLVKLLMHSLRSYRKSWSHCWHLYSHLPSLIRYGQRLVIITNKTLSHVRNSKKRSQETISHTVYLAMSQATWIWTSFKSSILVTVCVGVMQVEDLIIKEREMQEKLMTRHSTVVDSFEKKLRGQHLENRIALQQQKIAALRQEVESLLEYISEIWANLCRHIS